MDYGELKTQIAETAHRSGLTANIPGFVALAEAAISNTVRSNENSGFVQLDFADRVGDGLLWNTPNDIVEVRSMSAQIDGTSEARNVIRSGSLSSL